MRGPSRPCWLLSKRQIPRSLAPNPYNANPMDLFHHYVLSGRFASSGEGTGSAVAPGRAYQ